MTEVDAPPTVSVIIPTRNRKALLETSLTTVEEQKDVSLEVIVVDDASTDDTPATLSQLAEGGRLRWLRNPRPMGAAVSRNLGAEMARGEFIAFNDDDTVWKPNKLARQVEAMRANPDASLCHAYQEIVGHDNVARKIGDESFVGPETYREMLTRFPITTAVMLTPRADFEAVGGFDPTLPRLQDWELGLRLARRGSLVMVPEVLIQNILLPGGISSNHEALETAADLVYEKVAREHGPTSTEAGLLSMGLAHALLVHGRSERGKAYLRRARKRIPGDPRLKAMSRAAALGAWSYRGLMWLRGRMHDTPLDAVVKAFWRRNS